jgi:DNA modification methylase
MKKTARTPRLLTDLVADPHNRRKHNPRNLGMIASALQQVGAARSIVIDERNEVLAGNGVLAAAGEAGLTKLHVVDVDGDTIVAVRRTGLTPAQKRDLAIFDNRAAELAEWDLDQLAADLKNGEDLSAFFLDDELQKILKPGGRLKVGATDPDAVPELRPTSIKAGDLFELGRHRLLCGDSANRRHVARLVDAGRADALFTSPPYNVGVHYATHDDTTMKLGEYFAWLKGLAAIWIDALKKGRAFVWNVGVSPKTAPHRHVLMLEDAGLTYVRQFVWRKVGVPVPSFYHTRDKPRVRSLSSNYIHEMVYVMGTGELAIGPGQALRDEVLEHDVFSVNQAQATVDIPAGDQRTGAKSNLDRRSMKAHPAAFPVALVTAFLQHYAGPEEVVLEPFGGSGTTMIACEQLEVACRSMELAPPYCQVAIDRWEAFTGQKAKKVRVTRAS